MDRKATQAERAMLSIVLRIHRAGNNAYVNAASGEIVEVTPDRAERVETALFTNDDTF